MPALNRPNAPSRLPSACLERAFRQARFGNNIGSASSESQPDSASSSNVSPRATGPRRRSKRSDRENLGPGTSDRSAAASDSRSSPTWFPHLSLSGLAQAESNGDADEPMPPVIARSSRISLRSSISSQARKLFDAASPRPSVSSIKANRTYRLSSPRRPLQPVGVHLAEPQSSAMATDAALHFSQNNEGMKHVRATGMWQPDQRMSIGPSRHGPKISRKFSKRSIINRTKLFLKVPQAPHQSERETAAEPTAIGDLLNRTATALRFLAERNHTPGTSSSHTSTSNLSIAAHKWRFGHTKRQRTISMMRESTSSIRLLLRGKTPMTTPEPQEMYIAADDNEYPVVELTHSGAPAYLPSEARRINTPPLSSAGSQNPSHKLRGFFFDYNAPVIDNDDTVEIGRRLYDNAGMRPRPDPKASQVMEVKNERQMSRAGWYQQTLKVIDDEEQYRAMFVRELPDHLPSSPLCPLNPKYRGGSSGNCPMHGFSKRKGTE